LLSGHTATHIPGAVDRHLASKDFEGVRTLTDKFREANALDLPAPPGTRVTFAGSLGAVLSMKNPPEKGAQGTVVSVKSAGGEITSHEGRVFVKFEDGELRTVHAEFLRPAKEKQAQVRVGNPRLNAPGLEALVRALRPAGAVSVSPGLDGLIFNQFGRWEREQLSDEIEAQGVSLGIGRTLPVFGDFSPEGPGEPADYVFVPLYRSRMRAASLGDLTEFMKTADGNLVHKSTKDLWSLNKDADGILTVERLFDSLGEPLKG
jgi:hypothetical protein